MHIFLIIKFSSLFLGRTTALLSTLLQFLRLLQLLQCLKFVFRRYFGFRVMLKKPGNMS